MKTDSKEHQEYMKSRRLKKRMLLRRFKRRKGCAHCGYNKYGAALQFDHIIPETKTKRGRARNGQAIGDNWGKAKIKRELALCQVLCANCHHIKSHIERYGHETCI